MSKSPRRSPKRSAFKTKACARTASALGRAFRARKPNKKLRELMQSKLPWEQPPLAPPPLLEDTGPIIRDIPHAPPDAVCVWCGTRGDQQHKPTCPSHTTVAAQAENDKLMQQPGTKPSNPKDALGINKVPYSTISQPVMAEVGVAMLEGALKYGRHNYRAIGVRASVYFDAGAARHMALWWEGEDEDPDTCELAPEGQDTGVYNGDGKAVIPGTGLHHITKAIAGLCVIRDAMIQGKFIDDRPPKSPKGWQNAMNKKVKALNKKYPNAVPPYVEGDERMK